MHYALQMIDTDTENRQTTSFNDYSIEAGILLRGNGVSHAMLDIHMLFARGLPDAVAFGLLSSLFPTPTHVPSCYMSYARSHSQTTLLSVLSL